MITNEVILSVQIGSLTAYVVTLFVLYRTLVQQKNATIELQKGNIAFLKDQLAQAKSQSPDVLAQSLAGRVQLLEEELKRMEQDKTATNEQVRAKEVELNQARLEAEDLTKKVSHAKELLADFLCPHCGELMAERSYHSEFVEYQGHEIDVDHEHVVFECGYEMVDGEARGKCKNRVTKATKGKK